MQSDWKHSNMALIFKGGKREDPLNYRPVSLTSVMAKMCEEVIKESWKKHVEENNMISERATWIQERKILCC